MKIENPNSFGSVTFFEAFLQDIKIIDAYFHNCCPYIVPEPGEDQLDRKTLQIYTGCFIKINTLLR